MTMLFESPHLHSHLPFCEVRTPDNRPGILIPVEDKTAKESPHVSGTVSRVSGGEIEIRAGDGSASTFSIQSTSPLTSSFREGERVLFVAGITRAGGEERDELLKQVQGRPWMIWNMAGLAYLHSDQALFRNMVLLADLENLPAVIQRLIENSGEKGNPVADYLLIQTIGTPLTASLAIAALANSEDRPGHHIIEGARRLVGLHHSFSRLAEERRDNPLVRFVLSLAMARRDRPLEGEVSRLIPLRPRGQLDRDFAAAKRGESKAFASLVSEGGVNPLAAIRLHDLYSIMGMGTRKKKIKEMAEKAMKEVDEAGLVRLALADKIAFRALLYLSKVGHRRAHFWIVDEAAKDSLISIRLYDVAWTGEKAALDLLKELIQPTRRLPGMIGRILGALSDHSKAGIMTPDLAEAFIAPFLAVTLLADPKNRANRAVASLALQMVEGDEGLKDLARMRLNSLAELTLKLKNPSTRA